MGEPSTNNDRSQLIERVLVDYMRRVDAGERIDREEFLAAHAEFADELRTHFDTEDAIDDLMGVATSVEILSTAAPLPRRFGEYELREEIGRGGMGVVYRAHQIGLDRTVAVKMILAGQLASKQDIERFRREAQAAASLRHPHIVAIYEIGEFQGFHYFSMDYVEGQSLSDMARSGPIPPKQSAAYILKVAQAIHYAHELRVLHRDLKPANILIDDKDEPHITDFGLARLMHADSGLTGSGVIVGSPSYMPPEQIATHRGPLGPHSDVYSLGATLYELLTGCSPFPGASPLEVIAQVLDVEPRPPRSTVGKIPHDLETICLVCLCKEPSDRYRDANELAKDIERWLTNKPIKARRIGPVRKAIKWGRRNPMFASLLAIAAGFGLMLGYQSFGPVILPVEELPRLIADEMTVREGENARVVFRLTKPSEKTVEFNTGFVNGTVLGVANPAMVGPDAPQRTGHVVISPGDTEFTVQFATNTDSVREPDETIGVYAADVVNAISDRPCVPLVLQDAPPPQVSVTSNKIMEGQKATITFQLSAPSIDTVRFKARTLGGEFLLDAASPATVEMDVEHLETDVEFSPGESLTTITVQTLQDELRETTETFVVAVTDVTFATTVQPYWPVEILDDD